ncbi:hypothetical protein SCP_1400630 [Sparassis crispa]|uniref:Uncharacterized protein n=1 Tax=Sparassis crispa TaxID=139825 RepID=A0A401H2M4_9APHY|nr:hypothetical protein SCP_1400630 [Sparassis crispa]GBE88658.1 hypothetical protein SCP_1400630 [Sparassis crispa]
MSAPVEITEDDCKVLDQMDVNLIPSSLENMFHGYYGEKDEGRIAELATIIEAIFPIIGGDSSDGIGLMSCDEAGFHDKKQSAGQIGAALNNLAPSTLSPVDETLDFLLSCHWNQFVGDLTGMKPLCTIVIIHGAPPNPDCLKRVIFRSMFQSYLFNAKRHQVRLFFFQMGNPDKLKGQDGHDLYIQTTNSATAFLWDLDENLKKDYLG